MACIRCNWQSADIGSCDQQEATSEASVSVGIQPLDPYVQEDLHIAGLSTLHDVIAFIDNKHCRIAGAKQV